MSALPTQQRMEHAEAAAFADLYAAAGPLAAELRSGFAWRGETLVTWIAAIDVLKFSRVIGVGLETPVTGEELVAIAAQYDAAAVPRSFVQLAPDARPAEAARILTAAGWTRHNNWARLARATAHPPAHVSRLRIEAVGAERAQIFGSICGTAFKLPELIARWAARLVGQPGWTHYLAYEGMEPVGTAALRIDGDIAWFGYAATLAAARGRGAQSALIARRLSDAARLGCTHAVVETAEDLPDAPSTSLRNLRRQGFEQAYLRANYVRVRKPA